MTARCQQAAQTLGRLCAGWRDALNSPGQKEALEELHHLQALLTVSGTEVAPLTAGNGQKILALQRQLAVKVLRDSTKAHVIPAADNAEQAVVCQGCGLFWIIEFGGYSTLG